MSENIKKKLTKSTLTAVICILIALLIAGGTVAYLVAESSPVVNKFTPGKVDVEIDEKTENGVKSEVRVKNTGNTAAYIRAKVVITWKDTDGNVFSVKPEQGADYTIVYPDNIAWIAKDGYYYFADPVAPNAETGVLIANCQPVDGRAPEGYNLSVEILAQGIQAAPSEAVSEAWHVTIAEGSVTAYSAEGGGE